MIFTCRILIALAFVSMIPRVATVKAQTIEVLTEPHARSKVILRIVVDDLPDDRAVYFEVKGPNDPDYRELYLFSANYSEIEGRRFDPSVDGKRTLIAPVFLSHVKTLEHARHVFGSAGTYSLRLKTYHHDNPGFRGKAENLIELDLEMGMPSNADLKYFELTSQERISSLFGASKDRAAALSQLNGDILGLALVAEIVESTRRVGDPTHGKSEWADPLYDLAFAVPDSSYAPYVAYYAACSYMWQRKNAFVKTTYGFDLPDKRFADLDYYKKAHKALKLALERGDPYIKPFAMCFLAGLKAWAADFAGARELMHDPALQTTDSAAIAAMADQLRRHIEKQEAAPDR